jgi:hypothetical protein
MEQQESSMKVALLGAAVLAAALAGPAVAQEVIYNPGYCAQFYPNANCQNKGPGNPYTGDAWLRLNQGGPMAGSPHPDRILKRRAYRSQTSMQ